MDEPAGRDESPHPDLADEGFVESRSPSPMNSVDDTTPIIEDIKNYSTRELRPPRRGLQPTTWLDNDTTGNYDPAQERMMRHARRRPQHRVRPPGDQDKERIPAEKAKLKVTITFTSPEGKENLFDIIAQIQAQEAADQEGYKLRTRPRDEHADDPDTEIDLTAKPFARGCWECAALAGHSGESQCSLLHDERHWPCLTCQEDRHDCQLITPPARKRQCEPCKRRRIPCSYTYTKKHGASCSQCESTNMRCVAGPDLHFIKQRIRLERDWEKDPLPTKKKGKLQANEDCWECSRTSIPCRYECEEDGSPCEACKQNGNPCTTGKGPPPQPKPRQSRKRKRVTEKETYLADDEAEKSSTGERETKSAGKKDETSQEDRRDSALEAPQTFRMPNSCNPHAIAAAKKREQEIEAERLAKSSLPSPPSSSSQQSFSPQRFQQRPRGRAIFRRITTSFSHPIQYNCDVSLEDGGTSRDTSKPCHFCTLPDLPFHGFGRLRNVEVIDFQDYAPYIETRHGHASRGIESTRVCAICTTARLPILMCGHHNMVPIPGTDYTDEDLDAAMDDVLDGINLRDIEEYCALCGHLAQYECQNEQDPCGLRLCAGCAETMVVDHHADLQHMLNNSNHEPTDEAPLGLRADAEFLDTRRGTLARFWKSWRPG